MKLRHWWQAVSAKRISGSYESELKVTLILILLFLILINFSSLRIAGRLSDIYEEDSYQVLEGGASKLISYIREDVELLRTTQTYRKILAATAVAKTAFAPLNLLQSPESLMDQIDAEEKENLQSYYSQLSLEKRKLLGRGETVRCGFGTDRDRDGIVVLIPFRDKGEILWVGLFLKNASGLRLVQTVMSYNFLFQIAGVLAILLVAYAYLKITLNPFRKIATEARKLKLESAESGESVEQVVETFKNTIVRLQENETKLKQLYSNSQERAARLEQFNQYILESMLSGLIGIDREGRIVHLNKSARLILELDENEVDLYSFKNTFAHYPPIVNILEEIIARKTTVEKYEQRVVQATGQEKILDIAGSPVHDHNDRVVGAIVLLADLTEVRRLQSEIAFKEKMAAIGEMSAGLAHEMRNAMMAIVGYSRLLGKIAAQDLQVQEIAASIGTESTNCETMLKRFLMFAKPDVFTPEPLNLIELADAIIQKSEPPALTRNINLITDIEEKLPELIGDRVALDQILTNLVSNAIEATPHSGCVTLRIRHESSQNHTVFEVSDNGPGIPADILSKIFAPFFTTKEKGTGLGLAIVRKLIDNLGGEIAVDSRPGIGCTFKVTLSSDYFSKRHVLDKVPQPIYQ